MKIFLNGMNHWRLLERSKVGGFIFWRGYFGSIEVNMSNGRAEWKIWRLQVRRPNWEVRAWTHAVGIDLRYLGNRIQDLVTRPRVGRRSFCLGEWDWYYCHLKYVGIEVNVLYRVLSIEGTCRMTTSSSYNVRLRE